MRRLALTVLAPAVMALLAGPALAQFGGGMFRGGQSGLMLLAQKSVQEELKLTPEQVEKAEAAAKKQMEEMRGLRDLDQEERAKKIKELSTEGQKTVKEILKPEQEKRLAEVSLQVQGGRALASTEIADKLGLTEEQKGRIRAELKANQEKVRELFQDGFSDETRKKMQELNKELTDKIIGMLTDEQKTKWKEMTGKPFTGEIRFGPPGGG